ncbi:hypothetical protein FA13DRAFT_1713929 [Coprinellus micaceus]|uniref:Uncharacterized protein n=1 Tax=Coprinellus micaceus TaxID=71717 RepID=A0A4Y7SUF2_COPMI|nr:hypothetical protein FA13DRAFT_1713929 [Coprinellus micaceus]
MTPIAHGGRSEPLVQHPSRVGGWWVVGTCRRVEMGSRCGGEHRGCTGVECISGRVEEGIRWGVWVGWIGARIMKGSIDLRVLRKKGGLASVQGRDKDDLVPILGRVLALTSPSSSQSVSFTRTRIVGYRWRDQGWVQTEGANATVTEGSGPSGTTTSFFVSLFEGTTTGNESLCDRLLSNNSSRPQLNSTLIEIALDIFSVVFALDGWGFRGDER